MARLSTRYMGLKLPSPIIASSSSLTANVSSIKRAVDAGAGAVVLKSLFEEQIEHDSGAEEVDVAVHPEAEAYVRQMGKHLGPERYLELIAETRREVSVPVIASVNCVTNKWWGNYAEQIQAAGADGIELNTAIMPQSGETPEAIENRYTRIIEKVRRSVAIPLAVKIGPYFTSLPRFTVALREAGAAAIVIFNRFYQFDIDIRKQELAAGYQYSSPNELHTTLRWTSILSGSTGCDIASSTGVHDGEAVIKLLLAGADAVQVCSVLYKNGMQSISEMLSTLTSWMGQNNFASIDEFRGKLSQSRSAQPEAYERLQYIKALTGLS